jgi:hypothetical protein
MGREGIADEILEKVAGRFGFHEVRRIIISAAMGAYPDALRREEFMDCVLYLASIKDASKAVEEVLEHKLLPVRTTKGWVLKINDNDFQHYLEEEGRDGS